MEEEKKVYIGNLEYSVTEEDLQKWIEEKGFQAKEVKIIRDKFTGRSKGFGFAELETDEEVQKMIDSLNGQELKARNIRVNRARKRQPRFEEGD
jgi:RNA recognition motif-containing protein